MELASNTQSNHKQKCIDAWKRKQNRQWSTAGFNQRKSDHDLTNLEWMVVIEWTDAKWNSDVSLSGLRGGHVTYWQQHLLKVQGGLIRLEHTCTIPCVLFKLTSMATRNIAVVMTAPLLMSWCCTKWARGECQKGVCGSRIKNKAAEYRSRNPYCAKMGTVVFSEFQCDMFRFGPFVNRPQADA